MSAHLPLMVCMPLFNPSLLSAFLTHQSALKHCFLFLMPRAGVFHQALHVMGHRAFQKVHAIVLPQRDTAVRNNLHRDPPLL